MTYTTKNYELAINDSGTITVDRNGAELFQLPAIIAFNCLKEEAEVSRTCRISERATSSETRFSLEWDSSSWIRKEVILTCSEDRITLRGKVKGMGKRIDRISFFAGKGRRNIDKIYAPRFDWSKGIVLTHPDDKESLSCHQWLSPPPFYYGLKSGQLWFGAGIAAGGGEYNFISFDYDGEEGMVFSLAYEGHCKVDGEFESPELVLYMEGSESENDGLFLYTGDLTDRGLIKREKKEIPGWWREPIFCGWGQQRLEYRDDHDGHEMGNWINAGDYSTRLFYERHLAELEKNGINPGIVIIDCFWALFPSFAEPHPNRWPDMRGFIEEQHEKGRKVLLWLTPIIHENLPNSMCMTVEGRPVATDPTNPEFLEFFSGEIKKMISSDEGCLNADGFKIDFTQDIPAERGVFRNYLNNRWAIISEEKDKNYPSIDERDELVKLHGDIWGTELIKAYLKAIREPMKKAKADSLLITHTANPYFSEDVDMLRLNDMDGTSPDVLGIMQNRATIARSCNPQWLIDTDNDLMINKKMWLEYIQLQPLLGNPDTYYATGIAQSGELFNDEDYAVLRETFDRYRKELKSGIYAGRKLAE
ncbi:TIM-barrel domain-containing protein [Spirochaeta isovalerica]|uniref:Glycoside hydrolase family 31 TIM barrel domain-containing protein n=1 Tax=Spirochaeta isovalerica TaxID=150 RepID=A0A841R8R3_9SPIO|nr:TIM-barrel domain-containing protein [Spirochaeta isovalerica]MBB6479751.1 hypothetical protein [Spirochaeta isovalerica]